MKKFALVLALAMCASVGFAQALDQDSMELGLGGIVDFEGIDGGVDYTLDVSYGYFILDDIEIGPMIGFASYGKLESFSIGIFGEYNIDFDSPVVPYVAMRLAYVSAKNDYIGGDNKNSVEFEPAAGLKFFIAENVAISGEFYYDIASDDVYYNDNKMKNNDYGLKFGVRSFF